MLNEFSFDKETLAIVDGNYLLIRSACVATGEKNSKGEYVDGITGFLNSLRGISQTVKRIVVVFDNGHNVKRVAIHPEYKVRTVKPNEKVRDEEIRVRETKEAGLRYLPSILPTIGIPVVKPAGHEADDVIYFLAKNLSSKFDLSVISDDSDYIQMLQFDITLVRPRKQDTLTLANYQSAFAYPIKYFTLYKSIIGDNSDNIAGVPKIGPVTAGKIIQYLMDNNCENYFSGLLQWANSGNKQIHQNMKENIKLVKRNLKLVDISYMAEFEPLFLSEYENAVSNLNPDVSEFSRIFKSLEIAPSSFWMAYAMSR